MSPVSKILKNFFLGAGAGFTIALAVSFGARSREWDDMLICFMIGFWAVWIFLREDRV